MPAGGALCPLPVRLGGNSREGLPSAQHARVCADLIAVKRVMPLASWRFQQSDSGGFAVTMLSYFGMNGSGLAYAPSATVNAMGDVDFQWSAQYFEDEYGIQHPYRILGGIGSNHQNNSVDGASVHIEPIERGVNVLYGTNGFYGSGVVCVRVW